MDFVHCACLQMAKMERGAKAAVEDACKREAGEADLKPPSAAASAPETPSDGSYGSDGSDSSGCSSADETSSDDEGPQSTHSSQLGPKGASGSGTKTAVSPASKPGARATDSSARNPAPASPQSTVQRKQSLSQATTASAPTMSKAHAGSMEGPVISVRIGGTEGECFVRGEWCYRLCWCSELG